MRKFSDLVKGCSRKARVTCLIGALVIGVGLVYSIPPTFAYLITKDTDQNSFELAKVDCAVEQTGNTFCVVNTGSVPARVRARVVLQYVSNELGVYGGIRDVSGFSVSLGSGWTQSDDGSLYYDSDLMVGSDNKTTEVVLDLSKVSESIFDSKGREFKLNVEVLAEAIQSQPSKVVSEAWPNDI